MYVTTFYSFKGGVGRSMALANVAYQLARSGNRVLMVDFDLEAPGLDTFTSSVGGHPTPGIVDYITDYLAGGETPDVSDYLFEADVVGEDGGRLWVMPAGLPDEEYAARLSRIDWGALYERHDGYLMIEDMKAQWARTLEVDYVLIDSRTGHTDVAGICTRQLPDAVAIVFYPNEQNLRGLRKVVEDIRREPPVASRERIELLFVASNVPSLDDEEGVLQDALTRFQVGLAIREQPITVHHYDSLALVSQTIFTKDRPRTRLAVEYKALTDAIRGRNIEDPHGALLFLKEVQREFLREVQHRHSRMSPREIEASLSRISFLHAGDGKVLRTLARTRIRQGRVDEGVALLEGALVAGKASPDVYLELAEAHQRLGHQEAAATSAVQVLNQSRASLSAVLRSLEILRLTDPAALGRIERSAAIAALDPPDRLALASSLRWSLAEAGSAKNIVEPMLRRGAVPKHLLERASDVLSLSLLTLGEFSEAMQILEPFARGEKQPRPISHTFNYAMAAWGATQQIDLESLQYVVQHVWTGAAEHSPNYLQCLALAYWALSEPEKALEYVDRSRIVLQSRGTADFSCWRYLMATPAEFDHDLAMVQRLVGGEDILPEFIGRRLAVSGPTS